MEKERKLLNQEKQLYQARLRSEIRAKAAGTTTSSSSSSSSSQPSSSFGPMTSKDHIKALADRFMKAGAEDLWNRDDGPLSSSPNRERRRPSLPPPPLDIRKIIGQHQHQQRREYSRWRRNESSDSDDDNPLDWGAAGGSRVKPGESMESLKFGTRNEEEEEEGGFGSGRRSRKEMRSGAALRNHDVKREKRRVLKEGNWKERIMEIREDVRNRPEVVDDFGRRRREEAQGSVLTQKRFDEYNISSLTIKALNEAGYINMTVVQEAALPVGLEGKDALVKARTGTGKSVAFLLPAIEAVLTATSSNSNQRVPPVYVLIVSPTRELAIQIAAEANVLLRYHDGIGAQTLIGGTRFKLDQKRLQSDPCQIIVATPGRLLDHIENKSGFSVRMMGLKLLILDEADHLLDLGFRKDIEKIVDCIPRQRQSLLFSATVPKEVRRISQVVLKREHVFVDTVGLGGVETPAKVMQSFFVAPHELHFHLVHHFLKEHIMQELEYKVIVFCTTAMVAAFMYVFLRDLKMNVREIHSRKPQLYRTRISDEFRESKRLILVSSDVSARGVHYPDVTLVMQVGIPSDREQYIHRLGRTGREDKYGKGILLLAPWEEYFIQEISDLPIEKCQLPNLDSDIKQKVEESIGKVDTSIKEAAYHAWLGYYNSVSDIGRDKTMLSDLANRFSHSIGLEKPPALYRKTALKMGLKDVPGIRIRK